MKNEGSNPSLGSVGPLALPTAPSVLGRLIHLNQMIRIASKAAASERSSKRAIEVVTRARRRAMSHDVELQRERYSAAIGMTFSLIVAPLLGWNSSIVKISLSLKKSAKITGTIGRTIHARRHVTPVRNTFNGVSRKIMQWTMSNVFVDPLRLSLMLTVTALISQAL